MLVRAGEDATGRLERHARRESPSGIARRGGRRACRRFRRCHAWRRSTTIAASFRSAAAPYRHVGSVIDGDRDPVAAPQRLREERSGIAVDALQRRAAERDASRRRVSPALRRSARRGTRDDAARGLARVAQFHGSIGGTAMAMAGEGPLGEGGRGSWIVGLRNSYLDWPVKRHMVGGSSFAFADAHAKAGIRRQPVAAAHVHGARRAITIGHP